MLKKNLQVLAASLVVCSTAQADDYAFPAAFVPVGFSIEQDESTAAPLSCKEARETAWFIRELSRTDGDTNPEVAYVPCGHEILANSTADVD
jgi:hypothetical protein